MLCVAQYRVASVRIRSREIRRSTAAGSPGRGVAPLDELLGDPREQAGRRVVQRGGEGVGPGALDVGVARLVVPAGRHAVVERALGRVGRRLPLVLRQEVRVRDDDPGDRLGMRRGDEVADVRGDVLAVGEVARVAEHVRHERVHQLGEPLLGRSARRAAARTRTRAGSPRRRATSGQQVGEVQLQRERVRPAVHHEERRRVRGRPTAGGRSAASRRRRPRGTAGARSATPPGRASRTSATTRPGPAGTRTSCPRPAGGASRRGSGCAPGGRAGRREPAAARRRRTVGRSSAHRRSTLRHPGDVSGRRDDRRDGTAPTRRPHGSLHPLRRPAGRDVRRREPAGRAVRRVRPVRCRDARGRGGRRGHRRAVAPRRRLLPRQRGRRDPVRRGRAGPPLPRPRRSAARPTRTACARRGPRSSARGRPRSSGSPRCPPGPSTSRWTASGRSRRRCGTWSWPRTRGWARRSCGSSSRSTRSVRWTRVPRATGRTCRSSRRARRRTPRSSRPGRAASRWCATCSRASPPTSSTRTAREPARPRAPGDRPVLPARDPRGGVGAPPVRRARPRRRSTPPRTRSPGSGRICRSSTRPLEETRVAMAHGSEREARLMALGRQLSPHRRRRRPSACGRARHATSTMRTRSRVPSGRSSWYRSASQCRPRSSRASSAVSQSTARSPRARARRGRRSRHRRRRIQPRRSRSPGRRCSIQVSGGIGRA